MSDVIKIAAQLKQLKEACSHAGIDIAELRLAKHQDGVELMSKMNARALSLLREQDGLADNSAVVGDVLVTWPRAGRGQDEN